MILVFLLVAGVWAYPAQDTSNADDSSSRKVLGSSVVTSVSVIMDAHEPQYADALGKPVAKPQSASQVASPINLLNPDRYEFYTFDDSGDLVKRLMTLEEIQSIIANGDGDSFNYSAESSYTPEKKVNDVVNNVQNVLKEEILSHKNNSGNVSPILDTPDVSSSWSMILPAIFGNSGEQIKPSKPIAGMTPDTIMVEQQVPIVQKPMPFTKITEKPSVTSTSTNIAPVITVAIVPNKVSVKPTTKKPIAPKPIIINNQEVVKVVVKKPVIRPSTYRPSTYKIPAVLTTVLGYDDDDEYPNQHKSTTPKPTSTTKRFTTTIPTSTTRRFTTTIPITKSISTTPASGEPTTTAKRVMFEEVEEVIQTAGTTTTPSPPTTFIKLDTQKPVSQFIQLFEYPTTPKQVIDDDEIPSRITEATRPTSYTAAPSEYATTVFIIDHKTNTRIPITTKEQLATLLNSLPHESTTELLKPSSSNNFVQTVQSDELEHKEYPTTTELKEALSTTKQTTESIQAQNNAQFEDDEIPSYIKHPQHTTTQENKVDYTRYPTTEDIDKISVPEILDQLLLTSTNIYEINTELETKAQQTTENLIAESTNAESTTNREVTNLMTESTTLEKLAEGTTLVKETEATTDEQMSTKQAEDPTTKQEEIMTTKQAETMTTKQAETMFTKPLTTNQAETTEAETKQDAETTVTKQDEFTTTNQEEVTQAMTTKQAEATTMEKLEMTTKQAEATTLEKLEMTTKEAEATTFEKLDTSTFQKQTDPTETPTESTAITEDSTDKTEASIINSIELLIQQAVGNIAETITDEKNNEKISEIMSNMNDKPMSLVQMESATAASMLLDPILDEESTTEDAAFDALTEAMGSILSQVVSSEKQGLTTLEAFPTTPDEDLLQQKTTDMMFETTETFKDSIGSHSDNSNRYEESELGTTESRIETTTQPQKQMSQFEPSEVHNIEDILRDESEVTDKSSNNNEILNTEASSYIGNDLTTDKSEYGSTKNDIELEPFTTINPTTSRLEYDEEFVTTPRSEPNHKKTTLVAIITKPAIKYEDGEPVTIQPTALKPDVKKDDGDNWSPVATISPHSTTQAANKTVEPSAKPVKLSTESEQGLGLEDTTAHLDPDIYQFVSLCNELAFGFWNSVNNGISSARSVFVSPFAATSLLAMVFLGARGATSGEMNEILRLDDMVTFNPHLILKNVTESIESSKKSGVATSVILRELYSDKSKGHLLNFYKERAKQFYDGHVEEVSFKEVGDVIRRRTNLIVKRQTWGKIQEYIKDSSITVKAPLAGVSVSIFQTDCSIASTEARDGELYFVVLPSIRQRRLIPVPAAVWRSGFLAGYEPGLDATAVAIGETSQVISTIFVIPGQQGISAPGDGLSRLERHLVHSAFKEGSWTRLLKCLIPRPGLEVQIPRFSHRSVINASVALQHMGMKDLFDSHKADLRGLNGVANDLYLSDILQVNNFATCGEDGIGESHHSEIYPATANRTYRRSKKFKDVLQEDGYYDSELLEEPRDYQRAFHDPLHDPSLYALPLPLRPRQARLPDAPRLRFDRPFLYFVRHNPTGLILHMGRFNPRLLP